jgi:hypothetical protein
MTIEELLVFNTREQAMDGRFWVPTSNKFLGIIGQQSAMDWRFPSIECAILYS